MTVTPAAFSAGVFSPSMDSFNLVCVLSPLRRSLHTESFGEDYRYGEFRGRLDTEILGKTRYGEFRGRLDTEILGKTRYGEFRGRL